MRKQLLKDESINKELAKRGLTPNEWVTIDEAVQTSKYTSKQIKKLAETGVERIGKITVHNIVLYNLIDILQYQASHLKTKPIFDTVWDELVFNKGEYFFPICGYDNRYMISNNLKIINTTNGQVLTPQAQIKKGKNTGYAQVTLMLYGERKNVFIHQLVGQTQCINNLNKPLYHHINTKKHKGLYNNRASNLLAVYDYQHKELHKLLREGKKEEYKKMVKAIKEENKQIIYEIPHLDFKPSETFNYYMQVTQAGYNEYLKNGDVPINEIIGEYARINRL